MRNKIGFNIDHARLKSPFMCFTITIKEHSKNVTDRSIAKLKACTETVKNIVKTPKANALSVLKLR